MSVSLSASLTHIFCLSDVDDMILVVSTDDDAKASSELASLAENFREQAATLVDMLDISIPMVAKLKVKTLFTVVTAVILVGCRSEEDFSTLVAFTLRYCVSADVSGHMNS